MKTKVIGESSKTDLDAEKFFPIVSATITSIVATVWDPTRLCEEVEGEGGGKGRGEREGEREKAGRREERRGERQAGRRRESERGRRKRRVLWVRVMRACMGGVPCRNICPPAMN